MLQLIGLKNNIHIASDINADLKNRKKYTSVEEKQIRGDLKKFQNHGIKFGRLFGKHIKFVESHRDLNFDYTIFFAVPFDYTIIVLDVIKSVDPYKIKQAAREAEIKYEKIFRYPKAGQSTLLFN